MACPFTPTASGRRDGLLSAENLKKKYHTHALPDLFCLSSSNWFIRCETSSLARPTVSEHEGLSPILCIKIIGWSDRWQIAI